MTHCKPALSLFLLIDLFTDCPMIELTSNETKLPPLSHAIVLPMFEQ